MRFADAIERNSGSSIHSWDDDERLRRFSLSPSLSTPLSLFEELNSTFEWHLFENSWLPHGINTNSLSEYSRAKAFVSSDDMPEGYSNNVQVPAFLVEYGDSPQITITFWKWLIGNLFSIYDQHTTYLEQMYSSFILWIHQVQCNLQQVCNWVSNLSSHV